MLAPFVLDGPINRLAFETYVERVLVPELRQGDVVVMDNLSSHKGRKCARGSKRQAPAFTTFRPTTARSSQAWQRTRSERPQPALGPRYQLCRAAGSLRLRRPCSRCVSRLIVGYDMGRLIDARLTAAALTAAIDRRRPPPHYIHLSDRGSQYAAKLSMPWVILTARSLSRIRCWRALNGAIISGKWSDARKIALSF